MAMRLPRIFRTTPFRLTLLFLAVFAAAASAFLAYIYVATAGQVYGSADARVAREMDSLRAIYQAQGFVALNRAVIERSSLDHPMLYLLMKPSGAPISGSIGASPIETFNPPRTWASFTLTQPGEQGGMVRRAARGEEIRLAGGERLFVGADIGEAESYVRKIMHAVWGAGALIVLLGLAGGILVSRNVSRSIAGLTAVIDAARGGDISARAPVREAGDEYDELATGLNDMLDRLEKSMGGLRHAGDAIAHDLRSPLTRLRARLEAATIDVEAGRVDARAALHQAVDDADGVLRTFNTVLAIARLESAAEPPTSAAFDPGVLALSVAELYEPLCEDKGIAFDAEVAQGLQLTAHRDFVAQALANILDNAVKYTPAGGAITMRVRRRSSGDIEMSVTDTGPGIPEQDRGRVAQRFVRLENSRSEPGVGLGLSLVAAVARAHKGRLELDEGPGSLDGRGPGLRVALVFPGAV
jgi:signal transduction histidine kinase